MFVWGFMELTDLCQNLCHRYFGVKGREKENLFVRPINLLLRNQQSANKSTIFVSH